ncbi:hypothetical protein SASPL_101951 [Salvia splendens]|uniref:Integrator complex subunit 4 n=1 Tax=Salvia splendens TaxID=180675 RepID=A0A8X8YRQ4_SALSN|nr:hypothetical protein SASPL_101951 [Salvia splendens]
MAAEKCEYISREAILLWFTMDPYPYIREAALDGLVMVLNDGVVVEDRSLVGGCYFRPAELLFDADISVRRAAVSALCLMVRGMDVEIRVAAFDALGKVPTVSENILLQTSSKKPLLSTKEKIYPGQCTEKLSNIPATAAAFAFLHGLGDDFFQVRRSACRALQTLMVPSAEFACGTVDILVCILSDASVVVRLQALETLHHMASHGHLKVAEYHLDMFFSILIDNDALIRSAMRKALQFMKLQKLSMFRSCIEDLIKNLELYPQAHKLEKSAFVFFIFSHSYGAEAYQSWKEETRLFARDSHPPSGMGALEYLLSKMERRVTEMVYRYVGMTRNEELHILELMLVTYAIRLACGDACYFEEYMRKLDFVLCSIEYLHKEGSVEISRFVTDLQNVSREIGNSDDKAVDMPDLLLNSLEPFLTSGELKHLDAEVDVCGNDFRKPLPFIPGLPVGIPFEITLHNISSEIKLWLAISVGERSTQFCLS